MVAIAMTREMGTRGKDVAQGIADALGLKVIRCRSSWSALLLPSAIKAAALRSPT